MFFFFHSLCFIFDPLLLHKHVPSHTLIWCNETESNVIKNIGIFQTQHSLDQNLWQNCCHRKRAKRGHTDALFYRSIVVFAISVFTTICNLWREPNSFPRSWQVGQNCRFTYYSTWPVLTYHMCDDFVVLFKYIHWYINIGIVKSDPHNSPGDWWHV